MEIKKFDPNEYRQMVATALARARDQIEEAGRTIAADIEQRMALMGAEIPTLLDADFAFIADADIKPPSGWGDNEAKLSEVALGLGSALYANDSCPGVIVLDGGSRRYDHNAGRPIAAGKYRCVVILKRIGEVDQ